MLHHGDRVSIYDTNGNFECRGQIVVTYGLNPNFYGVQPDGEYSLSKRIHKIPASRIRKHYVAPHMVDIRPKHILDEI